MNQSERRLFLLKELLHEDRRLSRLEVPANTEEQKDLLRALMNVRMPAPVSETFLEVQDAYLQRAIEDKGVTHLENLKPVQGSLYLWQGDITTLACDAIVNAANAQMLGCFQPLHNCIDNCIHTYAGIQLRCRCAEIMEAQGTEEPTGRARITPAYNLPSRYILHTVGPIAGGRLLPIHEEQLASCYRSCLDLAAENGCESIAFCCISTGVFGFPQQRAAEIAVATCKDWLKSHSVPMKILFNVFKDEDLAIYQKILTV